MKKIFSLFKLFQQRLNPSPEYRRIKDELKKYPFAHNDEGPLVLCQIVEDFMFAHRFIHFLSSYKRAFGKSPKIGWILIRKPLGINRIRSRIRYMILNNFITDRVWTSLYRNIGGEIAFRIDRKGKKISLAQKWAADTQKDFVNKEDLLDLRIDNILVGDLVYDTYLRFKPAPTVDLQDPFLIELLVWCWDLHAQICEYFRSNTVSSLVTSYTAYIHHGLMARIALARGVQVFALGALNQLVVEPTPEFPFHKRNFHKYKEFIKNCDIDFIRKTGKHLIEQRMAGKNDPATSYMQRSAYHTEKRSNSSIFSSTGKPKAVVMGHDFFDSPHIYGKILFSDFYEWINFVFTTAKHSRYDFYYKPHPNGLPDNDQINDLLRSKYPHITFIDKNVSNLSMLDEGIDIAFTVYGTIAHEFAYRAVPVVCAGENPHQVYKFNICPSSIEELEDYIVGNRKPLLDNSEVPEFCFIHSYRFTDTSMTLFPFHAEYSAKLHFSIDKLEERITSMAANIERRNAL